MKRWLSFAVVLALLAAGLIASQARKVEAPVAPTALLYLVADTERELTRLPMKYTQMSDQDEIRIGNEIAKEFGDSTQDEEGKVAEAYLQAVGNRVAAHAGRKLPYKFHYLPDLHFVNAFAIPGGHVYMGAGLMSLMENEDELAAVLGHEIEHIDQYHCANRLQLEDALRHVPLGSLIYIPVEVFQAGYSKDEEFEADREGTRLAVNAGYSPEGAIRVFARFQKMEEVMRGKNTAATPEQEMAGAAAQILTGYFESHPPSADRVAQIQSLIAQEKWTLGQEKPLAVRYIFLAHQAEELVAAAKYDQAIQAASKSLELHPGHRPALVALAKARCATHDFAKALAAYQELLATHQADADAVRAFAEAQGSAAMNAKHFEEAGQFAAFSLELQPNNPTSLKLLAQVKLELSDVDAALEIGRKLQKLYPQAASQFVQTVNSAASQAFEARNYERAARFASCSLHLEQALQPEVESEFARSEFAIAAFREAADAYRTLIEADIRHHYSLEPSLIQAYANSLGALTQHADAAREFQDAVRPGPGAGDDLAAQIKIEDAGLLVMTGNDSVARSLSDGPASFAPEHAARLGWWYYRAGKYDVADEVLRRFLAQRPGDAGLQTALGWVKVEENAPADAARSFKASPEGESTTASARAGLAVVHWRLRQTDRDTDASMFEFGQLTKDAPEWTNPTWVRALYGPVTAQSAQEMCAEQQRRLTAKKAISR
ncbi:MAG TPA: M48 family metalloprotease [Candidatus Angelobacter sp.]